MEGKFFRGVHNDRIYLRAQKCNVLFRCEDEKMLKKVKSLPDFKVFCTFLHAGKPNHYGNRSRTLATIGTKTGTVYKQTVSKRNKKAKSL